MTHLSTHIAVLAYLLHLATSHVKALSPAIDCNLLACSLPSQSSTTSNPKNATLTSTPGTCKDCNVACPAIYGPICGSNGKTYDNTCVLNAAICANSFLYQAFTGECSSRSCSKTCDTTSNVMVCGSDMKTYLSACELENVACGKSAAGDMIVRIADGPCRPGMTLVTTGSGGGVSTTGPIVLPKTSHAVKSLVAVMQTWAV
ncbi:hypothetical protein BC829DRAFT_397490, partial [Chytridium lagenaria]